MKMNNENKIEELLKDMDLDELFDDDKGPSKEDLEALVSKLQAITGALVYEKADVLREMADAIDEGGTVTYGMLKSTLFILACAATQDYNTELSTKEMMELGSKMNLVQELWKVEIGNRISKLMRRGK
jgi:hypothetical protein